MYGYHSFATESPATLYMTCAEKVSSFISDYVPGEGSTKLNLSSLTFIYTISNTLTEVFP